MNKKLFILFSWVILLASPTIALAQNSITIPAQPAQGNPIDFWQLFNDIFYYVVWPVFIAAVIIAFIVAGFLFLTANGNEEKIKLGRRALLWGAVGVAVGILAFSAFATIQFILNA